MKIFQRTDTAGDAEGVAVTVDWVVLTAAIVGVAVAVLTSLHSGGDKVTSVVGNERNEAAISSSTPP